MDARKNIAIIMGGYSSEYDISMKSGDVVYRSLDPSLYQAFRVVIQKERWFLLDPDAGEIEINRHDFSAILHGEVVRFDCVFNAIHGSPGEDGLLQAYFQLLGIPQTASESYPAALTFNKRDLLCVLRAQGIPSAPSYALNEGDEVRADEIFERVGLPCFVKANRAGSSFGITLVKKKEALQEALRVAFREDREVLIESALQGTEISVGVIRYQGEVRVLPITEIVSDNEFFDFEAKYEGKSQEITPARIPEKIAENVRHMAARIYKTLGLSGYSRSEFILVGDTPHLLEVNTTPGLTEASILPQQAAADGIGLAELFGSAIEEALSKN